MLIYYNYYSNYILLILYKNLVLKDANCQSKKEGRINLSSLAALMSVKLKLILRPKINIRLRIYQSQSRYLVILK